MKQCIMQQQHRRSPLKAGNKLLTRRTFLQLAGASFLATAAGCAARTAPPAATPGVPGPTVAIVLTAQEASWELAPGKRITAWTYNGTVPGHPIRVREGDRVRVAFTNRLAEPTTIHWHGVDVPAAMDGVPDLSQRAVQPGTTFTYEFDARPAGTRWYHTHVNSARQQDLGLSAPFIIEPQAADPAADREYTLLLDDWVTNTTAPSTPSADNDMMGGGMMGGMMDDAGPAYDTFTINGKAFPATAPLMVRQGERVRLRLINASNMQTFVLRLAGHPLQVTHTDGNPLQKAVEVDVLPIVPAERYDVIFVADHPGSWPLYALNQPHTQGGLKTLVVYEGFESAPEAELPDLAPELRVWSYGLGQGVDRLPQASGHGARYQLTLSGGMMMSGDPNVWTINGKVYPQTDPLVAERNQLVSVRLSNMSMQTHPFHLHGQSFRVLRVGGQTLPAPLIKDTVDVPAMMGMVDLEIVAFNPGDWMFHCHKPMHMDGGMATLVKVG
jgi:FtsP/CotA-like multicopper oxidase with cupredoxin domain